MERLNQILANNNLTLSDDKLFQGKDAAFKVTDQKGNSLILKIKNIGKHEVALMELAKDIEAQLSFKVPSIIKKGKDFYLAEFIEGDHLNSIIDSDPQKYIDIVHNISQDYQNLTDKFILTENLTDVIDEGKKWKEDKLNEWTKPIIEAGLTTEEKITELKSRFKKLKEKAESEFFGFSHGNIIGDHIILSGDDIYLLDMHIAYRAGKGYLDFLRALDFMFLRAQDADAAYQLIVKTIDEQLSSIPTEHLRLALAFRAIGLLGCDIIKNNSPACLGDKEKKKQYLADFINKA